MVIKRVTGLAPVNMAIIKYWGKRDEDLILPLNDSLSVTFSTEDIWAKTTVAISPDFEEDELWLNSKKDNLDNPRLQKCIKLIKNLAKKNCGEELKWKMRIASMNNFPTGAGLASSAAGYACLVFVLAKLYGVEEELSKIARQGSGSACRSIYGGFVQWLAGTAADGSDSFAKQLYPAAHWPELHCLIVVVNKNKKKTSSTKGMRAAVATSELLRYRVSHCVQKNLEKLKKAIWKKDFEAFAEITMRDSNQFHAICLDTYPPEVYLNPVSMAIITFVHEYNAAFGCTKLAYTFDAGPNACLFLLEKDVPLASKTIKKVFSPQTTDEKFFFGTRVELDNVDDCPKITLDNLPENCVHYVAHTKVGDGPVIINDEEGLISDTGNVINSL